MTISADIVKTLHVYQKNEITEYHIYHRLARSVSSAENKRILEQIAGDELRHYEDWKQYTQTDVGPNWIKVWWFYLICRLFGFTFGIKLMENGEENAQENYTLMQGIISEAASIAGDENEHEKALIGMLDEERLRYTGSVVLGLNDALVELTGALAGLTLALQNTGVIALTGLITGIAAALSMATSEYLSIKTEENDKNPLRASVYTGTAYLATVFVLIWPYLIFENYFFCLACTLTAAIAIIGLFTYYIAVAKDLPFKKRFTEMACLSLGVAGISFGIGFLIRQFLGVEI